MWSWDAPDATDDSNAPYSNALGTVSVESVVVWSLVGEDASCGQPIFVTGRSQNVPRKVLVSDKLRTR